MTVAMGDVLAGKYRVDRILGMGGMGVVVAAHHIQLDDKVAIKFMLPEALGNPEAVARFLREARAAVRIKSEHVARVSDVGTLETGAPYMVMEYLEGRDLSQWLRDNGALPVGQAVELLLQACEALAEAHMLGIVHRDLKPANLFVIHRPDGSLGVKVLDFGISKMVGSTGSGTDMTRTSATMGSPLYMSPEQLQSSRDVDARSDIWSLGVILYELLTNQAPFNGETLPQVLMQIMQAPTPPLRDKRHDAPQGLEAVLFKCLAKDRAQRFQSVHAMAVALAEFGPPAGRGSVERIAGVMRKSGVITGDIQGALPAPAPGPGVAATTAPWAQTGPKPRSNVAAFGVAAVVLVSLLAGGAWFALHGKAGNEASAATHPEPASPSVMAAPPVAPTPPAPAPTPAVDPAPTPAEPVPASSAEASASSSATPSAAKAPIAPRGAPIRSRQTSSPSSKSPAASKEAATQPKPKDDRSLIDDRGP
jgi:serine/threonine-protein kinase